MSGMMGPEGKKEKTGEGGGNPAFSRRRVRKATESLNWTIDLPPSL
jgi:hypothetical protein